MVDRMIRRLGLDGTLVAAWAIIVLLGIVLAWGSSACSAPRISMVSATGTGSVELMIDDHAVLVEIDGDADLPTARAAIYLDGQSVAMGEAAPSVCSYGVDWARVLAAVVPALIGLIL